MKYLMGIDLGTSGVKAVVFDTNGDVITSAYRGYNVIFSGEGFAQQDMESLWQATLEVLREISGGIDTSLVCSIGLSGQMHGTVLLDENGKALSEAIIWMDRRTKNQITQIYETVGKESFHKKTLNQLSTGFMLPTLLWVKENQPEIYNRARIALFPKDYIRYKLCGKLGTDFSDASGSLGFDVAKREWAYDIIDKLSIRRDLLAECYASHEIAGELTEEAARASGLNYLTPVVYGGGDLSMNMLGNGIYDEGTLSANIGTASQLACVSKYPVYDSQYRTNTFCFSDCGFTQMGASLNGGGVLKWLSDKVLPGLSYTEMDKLVMQIEPGSEGVVFLPYLCGERTPHMNPDAKGIMFGLGAHHDQRHIIRSAMESLVFSLRESLEILDSLGIKSDRVIASGGGARSRVILQMQADILQKPIYIPKTLEQACLGAAISAGAGCGVYTSLEDGVNKTVKTDETPILPNEQNFKVYDKNFEIYKQLYINNKDLFNR